ncbi:MAG TPA: DUF4349 domain-containing protein [Gaiellales bacterium]
MSAIRRAAWTAGAVVVLSGLVGAAAGCAGGSASNGADSGGGATRGAFQKAAAPQAALALQPSAAGVVAGSAHSSASSSASDVSLKTTLPAIRSAVIKTATLDLRVPHGRFGSVMDAASKIAEHYGGFVSQRSSSGTRVHDGRLVMRVPVGRFTDALPAVERLGRPTNESVVGVDVTQQFVDLGARLDNLRSQEQALRHLMERTQSVSDTIRVQGVLQGVELQMEEIQGRLIYLRNRTELSTISVDVQEAGARPAPPGHASAIWKAGRKALHSATTVVTGVIVGAGFVIPIAILALLAVLIGRFAAPWAAPLAARRRGQAPPPSNP